MYSGQEADESADDRRHLIDGESPCRLTEFLFLAAIFSHVRMNDPKE